MIELSKNEILKFKKINATEKVGAFVDEKAPELKEKAEEFAEKVKDKVEDIKEDIKPEEN